ncbi:hypothetical protein FA95DRAFT_211803 [Auriscalpium vulgare]|uniref:Uncharacterized protein n=1 Tax=Auriscalpium vulgare TaxID=40419 RepID=A0ACB8RLU2_9AGAM|nr:hypothetical protein FA95DRAFT_211803 [Auriscalpium vulgare]
MYAPGVPDNVAVFTAPQLFGFLFNWGLFGVLSAQTYYYSLHFPADRRSLKVLVYGLYILETVQTGMATQTAYANFGKGWGDLDRLHNRGTLWLSVPLVNGIVSSAVQSFFAFRIFALTGSKCLHVVITATAVVSGCSGIADAFVSHLVAPNDSEIHSKAFVTSLVWLVGNSLCDLIICSCMLTWYLQARRRVFFQDTTDIVSQILRLSVATGLSTAAVAAVTMILFLVYEDNNFYMCPVIMLGKLYSNSLLVVLNNRHHITINRRPAYVYDLESESIRFADGTVTRPVTGPLGTLEVPHDRQSDAIDLVTLPKEPDRVDPDGSSSTGEGQQDYKVNSCHAY